MIRRLVLLGAGCSVVWLLAAGLAWWLGGTEGLIQSAVAALLCLIPAAVTMLWCDLAVGSAPEQQLMAVLGGTAVRMAFVIVAGLVLSRNVPVLNHDGFWLWLVGFYLTTLALEMVLVVRRPVAVGSSQKPESSHG
jgi:hypothetical protein